MKPGFTLRWRVFCFLISWSHWAISYLNAPVIVSELEPSGSWCYFVKSVCCRKPRRQVSLWQWKLSFQLQTEIPVSNPEPRSPRSSRHECSGCILKYICHELDKWEWIWLTAHRLLLVEVKIPKKWILNELVCGFEIKLKCLVFLRRIMDPLDTAFRKKPFNFLLLLCVLLFQGDVTV